MSLSRYRYAESVGSSEVIIFRVSGFVIIMQQRYFTAAINTESLEFSFIFTGNTLRVIICWILRIHINFLLVSLHVTLLTLMWIHRWGVSNYAEIKTHGFFQGY